MSEFYTYSYFEDSVQSQTPKQKKFRFFGYSFRGENKQDPKKTMNIDELNMLVIVVEDVDYSEVLFRKAVTMYTERYIEMFRDFMILLTLLVISLTTVRIIALMKNQVASPIISLTDMITNPKETTELKKFRKKIDRLTFLSKAMLRSKNLKQINEVKQLQALCGQFFRVS